MINREELAQEFIRLVKSYYPKSGQFITHCYVKILECYIERLGKRFYYIGVYYPERLTSEVQAQQDVLRDIAENMGLIEVVCINANRIVRDPRSRLKHENPRLWLDLYWVASHKN
ncbi:MAG TPA: hypothetical protein DDZ80_25405 [Cyanobacteria bacterium UBA8803]|nr:hypothetical protein [Cyanobacteria bacterium UBA9273]HBL61632.1 hypothetical protein [Cyanobacteria bacterium UBA8803]